MSNELEPELFVYTKLSLFVLAARSRRTAPPQVPKSCTSTSPLACVKVIETVSAPPVGTGSEYQSSSMRFTTSPV